MELDGLKFVLTCSVSPEQYDVFDSSGKQVGYIRLRWGHLSCTYPDVSGETIYGASIGNTGWEGCFCNEQQRKRYLKAIAKAINEKIAG